MQDAVVFKIEQICKDEKWAATVEPCIAGRGDPWRCIDEAKLVERLPPAGLELKCGETVFHDVLSIGVKADGEGQEIGESLMKDELAGICARQGWSNTMLGCLFYVGPDPAALRVCVDTWLTEDQAKELDAQLAAFAARMNSWIESPPSCDKVAMAYYSDARWAEHPTPALSDTKRKQAVADSRKQLAAHCKKKMSPVLRGCVVAAPSEKDAWHCWFSSNDGTSSRWASMFPD